MNRIARLLLGTALAAVLFSAQAAPLYAILTLGDVTLTAVKCRIFTPNGDGFNDKARLEFDNPQMLPLTGTVYDMSGARVSDLQAGSDPATVLLWDGKDDSGQVVAGGIYIYQIDFQGKHATGTVVVAR